MKAHGPHDRSSGARDVPADRPMAGDVDFAWPPQPDDLDRCAVVSLTGDAEETARLRVLVRLPDVLDGSRSASPGAPRPAASPTQPRSRQWAVEQPAAAYPFHVDGDDPMAAASAGGEVRRAIVAVAAGVSLAVLSYVQFRSARADAPAMVAAVAQAATAAADRHGPEPVMDLPAVIAEQVAPAASLERRLIDRAAKASAADAPARARLARFAAGVIDEVRAGNAVDATPAAPAPVASATEAPEPAEPIAATRIAALVPVIDDGASALPVATAAPIAGPSMPVAEPIAAAVLDPVRGDEDHIRAALTQWRTAYSSLDARAARAVWPSVDARALERAFQDLKSQDLRFDRCDLSVNGGRAQAACTGRAIYVPRVGNQSPRTAPREWTFELRKRDERWTIASARAS